MKITSLKNKPNKKKEKKTKKKRNKYNSDQLSIIVQSIVCIIILCIGVFLKTIGGNVYETARLWYLEKINDSIIIEDKNIETRDNALFVNKQKTPEQDN
jgi:hypothetical protein